MSKILKTFQDIDGDKAKDAKESKESNESNESKESNESNESKDKAIQESLQRLKDWKIISSYAKKMKKKRVYE